MPVRTVQLSEEDWIGLERLTTQVTDINTRFVTLSGTVDTNKHDTQQGLTVLAQRIDETRRDVQHALSVASQAVGLATSLDELTRQQFAALRLRLDDLQAAVSALQNQQPPAPPPPIEGQVTARLGAMTVAAEGLLGPPPIEPDEPTDPAEAPVNATVSAWSAWTPFSEWAPDPTVANRLLRSRSRTRTVLSPATNGGTTPPLVEEMPEWKWATVTLKPWTNANFDARRARADCILADSLRTPESITARRHKNISPTTLAAYGYTTADIMWYDADVDACRFTLPPRFPNIEQTWHHFGATTPPSRLAAMWEVQLSDTWRRSIVNDGFKFLQVRRSSDAIWLEPDLMAFVRENAWVDDEWLLSHVRVYPGLLGNAETFRGPFLVTAEGVTHRHSSYPSGYPASLVGQKYGSDAVGPVRRNVTVPLNVPMWCLLDIEHTTQVISNSQVVFVTYTVQVGETGTPVVILDRVAITIPTGSVPQHADYEMNQSSNRWPNMDGATWAFFWGKNLTLHKDCTEPLRLFDRPNLASATPPPTSPVILVPDVVRPSDRRFYDEWAVRAIRSRGLHSDADIAAVDHKLTWNGVVVPQMMFYDPAVDAVRCVIPAGHINFRQMRIDLNLGPYAQDVDELDAWLTWDSLYLPSFVDNFLDIVDDPRYESARQQGYKTWMVTTYRTSAGQWNSPRFRFIGHQGKVGWMFNRSDYFAAIGGPLNEAGTDYLVPPFRPPAGLARNGREREAIFGDRRYGSDCLVPFTNEFPIDVMKWTRHWARYRMRRDVDYVDYSLYAADVDRDPICIYRELGIQMLDLENRPRPLLRQFWFEYNSSASRLGGDLEFYHPWLLAVINPDLSRFMVRPRA